MSNKNPMCSWCLRGKHEKHLANCPALTGVKPRSSMGFDHCAKRTGAYLRRPRGEQKFFVNVLYLVETRHPPDSPAAIYREDEKA